MKTKITILLLCALTTLVCSREFELEAQFGSVRMTPAAGLTTSESGVTTMLQIELTYPPTTEVVLTLSSSNVNEGQIRANGNICDAGSLVTTATSCTLIFTPQNWNVKQNLVVVGQDDAAPDGAVEYSIQTTVASSDSRYQNLRVQPLLILNSDNDAGAELILSNATGLVTRESGAMTTSFRIRLATQPAGDIVFNNVRSSVATEGTVVSSATLTFTSTNWNTDQTVVVSGVADNKLDGDVPYAIYSDPATGLYPYAGVTFSVDVTNINTDVGKFIYVSGAFSVTLTPPLIGGIPGADAKCDAGKPPAGGTYKAILVGANGGGTIIREAGSPGVDWVLAANTKYYRYSDKLLIGTTNAARVFPFNLANSIAPGNKYWTGLNAAWLINPTGTCNAFLGGGGTGTGTGNGNATDATAINDGVGDFCSNPLPFLCAEQ